MPKFKVGDLVYSPDNRYTITSAKEYYVGLVLGGPDLEVLTLYATASNSILNIFFKNPHENREIMKDVFRLLAEENVDKRFALASKIQRQTSARYFTVKSTHFKLMTKETITEAFDDMRQTQERSHSFIPHNKYGHDMDEIRAEFIRHLTYFFDRKHMQSVKQLPNISPISW